MTQTPSPSPPSFPPSLSLSQQWELSTKLLLNAVSTGAHVLKGKIYQNHMVDVQVTNSKLYRRATRLLQVWNTNTPFDSWDINPTSTPTKKT